jgi:hypothetical protein
LKKLIVYDQNLLPQVVKFASFPKSMKVKETEFMEHKVTPRKYHFVQLDAIDIRTCGWNLGWISECYGMRKLNEMKRHFII